MLEVPGWLQDAGILQGEWIHGQVPETLAL
jgi:hypothetical protein